MNGMLSCAINRRRLNGYIDDELPERRRRAVERHLTECASCRLLLNDLQRLGQLLNDLDVPPIPDGLASGILVEASHRRKRGVPENHLGDRGWRALLPQPWIVKGATAAALVLGLATGAWMGWTSFRSPGSGLTLAVTKNEHMAERLYALDALSAEPRGSIGAATIALLENGR